MDEDLDEDEDATNEEVFRGNYQYLEDLVTKSVVLHVLMNDLFVMTSGKYKQIVRGYPGSNSTFY